MTGEHDDFAAETATDSHRHGTDRQLAGELARIREELNNRAGAADEKVEEELYLILALRLGETQQQLEAMDSAREPESGFSLEDVLDSLDEELVPGETGGFKLAIQAEESSS